MSAMSVPQSHRMDLQQHFARFREGVIGEQLTHTLGGADRPVVYADWTASGRLYRPIEHFVSERLGPYVANTHTESTLTGCTMTHAYHQAQRIIKKHVRAGPGDVLIAQGSGMTTVVNKFQRILGLRLPEHVCSRMPVRDEDRPLVVITHMEHHSNQTTWEECAVKVEIIRRAPDGQPDLEDLDAILQRHAHRKLKIGAFSACSNVTGIITPYHRMAAIMHRHGGLCFVDFAASAPYVDIDMHPDDPAQKLDAIYFSPHKFLGGPGSSGVLLFDSSLYHLKVPDQPGGGTVAWTNPWGGHRFVDLRLELGAVSDRAPIARGPRRQLRLAVALGEGRVGGVGGQDLGVGQVEPVTRCRASGGEASNAWRSTALQNAWPSRPTWPARRLNLCRDGERRRHVQGERMPGFGGRRPLT